MTGPCLGDLFFERADRLAVIARGNRRDRRRERAGFLDALSLHVFEKLWPDPRPFDQLENGLGLGLIDRPADAVVIIADDDNVEDVAQDIAAEKRIGAADRRHLRLAAGGIERRRHKGILVMAARQMLQTAADQDAAALAGFIGIREVHLLFRQKRAQMFVDLLSGAYLKASWVPFCGFALPICESTARFLTILVPASFLRI